MLEQRFVFGPFTLDVNRGVLLRNGQPVGVGQRAVLLLAALARANGNVVTKAELIDAAWPHAVVEESNLTVQIGALRKLLGAADDGADYIATVSRVGYRLGVPVGLREEEVAPASTTSIAVLPLVNLGSDPQQEYFADGVTEDIIMALSRFRWFQVIGRSGSFAFKGVRAEARDVARKLNVRYVLEGSVRRAPPLVRISVQLVDASSQGQLWGEQYEIGQAEVAAVQDAIAQQVVGAVEPELLRLEAVANALRPRQGDPTVRDLVHRGTWLFHQVTQPTHLQARELFRQACAVQPIFGPAHFWLARVNAGIVAYGWSDSPDADVQEGVASAIRAIHADEKDPYAHYGLAIISVYAQRLDQAVRAAQRAVELAPGFALGHLVLGMARLHAGNAQHAIDPLTRGLQLNPFDPQNFVWYNLLAYAHLFTGDPGAALQFAARAQEVRPDWPPAVATEICCQVEQGHIEAARELHRRLRNMPVVIGDTLAPLWQRNPFWAQAIDNWLRAAA